jgi:hypothetical protein
VDVTVSELDVEGDLKGSLGDLRHITRLLQRYGFFALVFTVLNFAALILASSARYFQLTYISFVLLVVYLPISLTLIAVICIIRYESLRKRGDALFEEISDELQWNVRTESKANPHTSDRPNLNARVALRSFARATDLPLIPGRYGPGIYATINFLMLFIGFYIFRMKF